jgi:hypothetical protein
MNNINPLNPGQAKMLRATIYDLSELSAKQILYGIVQFFSVKTSLSLKHFEGAVDDARKLTDWKNINQRAEAL